MISTRNYGKSYGADSPADVLKRLDRLNDRGVENRFMPPDEAEGNAVEETGPRVINPDIEAPVKHSDQDT